jgi:hypothetical protein
MVRAKFIFGEERNSVGGSKTLVFWPEYDRTIPEDQRFSDATPSGRLEMMVNNPAAIKQFELGKSYYLDFTPAG